MKDCVWWAIFLMLVSAAAAQTPAAGKANPKPRRSARQAAPAVTAEDFQALRQALADQQRQIEQLREQLQRRDTALEQMQRQSASARSAAASAQQAEQKASEAQAAANALKADVNDLKLNATNAAVSLQEEQKRVSEMVESPLAIHYKGVTITPGGFLSAETVWRQHGLGADVNTPFNAIPFEGSGQQHLSEFFGSGRQSRIALLVEGKLSQAKLTGYYEMDWLSAGVTSNNNQSNSYTNRQRQLWGQAALENGWSFTGGQMWSLVAETRNGLDNRSEALPSTVDAQYQVGFSWARQYGFRVVKNFNNRVWLGFSIENAQTLMTAHGNQNNFFFGTPGAGGGLYNPTANYSLNVSPDYIVKAAFQPKYGHYELFGILRPMRDRVYPNATATPPSAAGAFSDTRVGGGIGANARWLVYNKHVEFGVHFLGGDGVGRYGTSTLPDATVRPDGTLALLHSYQGLGTLEFHHPKFDVYFNGGSEYVSRYQQLRGAGIPVGYGGPLFNNSGCLTETVPTGGNGFSPGSPGACIADTRVLIEGTVGFYIKFYNGSKGRLQWGPQYSHIVRNTWAGVGGGPSAAEDMLLTGFRYYLP